MAPRRANAKSGARGEQSNATFGPHADPLPPGAKAFACPGCGAGHFAVADETPPPATLQFTFTCHACGYKAGMGLG